MERGGVLRSLNRASLVIAFAILLGGCEMLANAGFFSGFRRAPQARDSTPLSEQGLGKLAKGDMLAAQNLFDRALEANPSDVHALLGKAMVFQQTGQLTQARSAYEALLALRPGDAEQMVVWADARPQPVREIASVNLALLQSRQVAGQMGTISSDRQAPMAVQSQDPNSQRRPQAVTLPIVPSQQQGGGNMPGQLVVPESENNVIARFQALRDLRDRGLITPEEYAVRRRTNLGALLPLTNPPPAAGLDRSVPSAEQIAQRLTAIGRALEMRAISNRQHAAERTMIVDGLMPSAPRTIANPGAPPRGLLEAADAVRTLERLQEAGLITSDEAAKERAAIEQAMQPETPRTSSRSSGDGGAGQASSRASAGGGPQPGVHIASYRSEAAAQRGWAQLRRAHSSLLGGLTPEVTRVNLGPGKGTFYRLIAGPLPSQDEAKRICARLKRSRQYCEPAFVGTG